MGIVCGFATPSWALVQGEAIVGYSFGYDDNISLGSDAAGQEEDISNDVYFDVSLEKDEGFFRYDVYGRTGFEAHSSGAASDQLYLNGGLDALWLIKPGRLTWDLTDVASVRRQNSRAIASRSNTEQTNILRTGPTVYFQPTGRTYLDLSGYYQQSWFEFGDSNEYVGASANAIYRFSELTRLSGVVSEERFLPDGGSFNDQSTQSASATLTRQMQRGVWYIGTGVSQITIDGVSVSDSEDLIPTYVAGLNFEITRELTFDISAAKDVITIGEDTLTRGDARGRLLGTFTGSSPVTIPARGPGATEGETRPISQQEFINLANEIDEFQYASGFSIDETVQSSLSWRRGFWGATFRVFARRLQVPEFQLELSQDARGLLFPDGFIDTDQQSVGAEFFMTLEPRPRWIVDAGLRVENRDLDAIDVLAEPIDVNNPVTRSFRETTFTTSVTFAASRELSFGSTFESVFLKDLDNSSGDVQSNRLFLGVEYSL